MRIRYESGMLKLDVIRQVTFEESQKKHVWKYFLRKNLVLIRRFPFLAKKVR